MRIDELSRELHAQAAEAMAGRTVAMADLRARRSRERRHRAVAGGVLAVALVAVGSAAGGSWLRAFGGPTDPVRPGPAGTGTAPPSPDAGWRPVRCHRPGLGGCTVPATLRYDGRVYADHDGGRQPLFAPNGVNRELRLSTVGDDLLLIGATGAGAGSRLEVTVGSGPARELAGDRLTAWPVPAGSARDVVVRETGTPARGEVLRIEGYVLGR